MNLEELKEFIRQEIETEEENYSDAKRVAGMDCFGAGVALGALEAYKDILAKLGECEHVIEEEKVVGVSSEGFFVRVSYCKICGEQVSK